MEVYILLEERFGVRDFAGYCITKEEAIKRKHKEIGYIKTEFIDTNKVIDNLVYVGSRYESSPDLHDYMGVFYSHEEAQKACGKNCSIYPVSAVIG